MSAPFPPVRLALIGGGRWGRNIIQTVKNMDYAELVHLASRNPENTKRVGESCRISPSWTSVLDNPDVEGVMVATPPETHFKIVHAALQRNLPVFVEKPLTMDAKSARQLAEESQKRNIPVIVDHIHLFNSLHAIIKQAIDRLGGLVSFSSCGGNHGPFRAYPPLWEWGPHDLSLVLDLVGPDISMVSCDCIIREQVEGHAGEVYDVNLTSPNCKTIQIKFGNMLSEKTRRLELICRDGTIRYDDVAASEVRIEGNDAVSKSLSQPEVQTSPLENAIRYFVSTIRAPSHFKNEIDLGVQVVTLLEDIQNACVPSAPTS